MILLLACGDLVKATSRRGWTGAKRPTRASKEEHQSYTDKSVTLHPYWRRQSGVHCPGLLREPRAPSARGSVCRVRAKLGDDRAPSTTCAHVSRDPDGSARDSASLLTDPSAAAARSKVRSCTWIRPARAVARARGQNRRRFRPPPPTPPPPPPPAIGVLGTWLRAVALFLFWPKCRSVGIDFVDRVAAPCPVLVIADCHRVSTRPTATSFRRWVRAADRLPRPPNENLAT